MVLVILPPLREGAYSIDIYLELLFGVLKSMIYMYAQKTNLFCGNKSSSKIKCAYVTFRPEAEYYPKNVRVQPKRQNELMCEY